MRVPDHRMAIDEVRRPKMGVIKLVRTDLVAPQSRQQHRIEEHGVLALEIGRQRHPVDTVSNPVFLEQPIAYRC